MRARPRARRGLTSALALVAASGAGMVATAPAHAGATGPWLPAQQLTSSSADATQPAIDIGQDGTAVAAYSENNVLSVAVRSPGTAQFLASVVVDPTDPDPLAANAAVAVAPDGRAFVAWRDDEDTAGIARRVVKFAERPPRGTFGAPVVVGAGDQPKLAVGADGTVALVFVTDTGIVRVARRPAGTAALQPSVIVGSGLLHQVGVSSTGTTVVAWLDGDNSGGTPKLTRATPTSAFLPAETITPEFTGLLSLAVDPVGERVFIVTADDASPFALRTFAGSPLGSLPAGQLGLPSGSVTGLDTATDGAADADALVISTAAGGSFVVHSMVRRASGSSFQGFDQVSGTGTAFAPSVGISTDRGVVVGWSQSRAGTVVPQTRTVLPGLFTLTASLGPIIDLSTPSSLLTAPKIAVAPDGSAVAVWSRDVGSRLVIEASVTANGPSAAAPTITGTPAVGSVLTCSSIVTGSLFGPGFFWVRVAPGAAPSLAGTGPTYTVKSEDAGAALACAATGESEFGSTTVLSLPIPIPAAPVTVTVPGPTVEVPGPTVQVPVPGPTVQVPGPTVQVPGAASQLTAIPSIKGTARVGKTLTCTPAKFADAPRVATSWLRGKTAIKGATKPTLKLTKKDKGKVVACRSTVATGATTASFVSLGVVVR